MKTYWLESERVRNDVFIPKYYDPEIVAALDALLPTHDLYTLRELVAEGDVRVETGDEIGSSAYGTGNIPFVRTSDISNWEIKTTPKQGVSDAWFQAYRAKQDVHPGDILLVRDGTYLIGTNCFVTAADKNLIYQSHILKLRVVRPGRVTPEGIFLALNSGLVQRQIRSIQFTADIIDTLGRRVLELVLPVPRDKRRRTQLEQSVAKALEARVHGKCFIKQAPLLVEQALRTGSMEHIEAFRQLPTSELSDVLASDTVSLEFGGFETTWIASTAVVSDIYLPKFYDPEIDAELASLSKHAVIKSIGELVNEGVLSLATGDEPGKMAYGTGDVPFVRTSDFANWELKHDPKQGLSEEWYEAFRESQDVSGGDILLVRDGTYLIGSTMIVAPSDARMVFCGGLYKIRSTRPDLLDPYLLLGLLNSYVVKRQIRSRQFTRDVIDTLGKRLADVRLPIPKDAHLSLGISKHVRAVVENRLSARDEVVRLAGEYVAQV